MFRIIPIELSNAFNKTHLNIELKQKLSPANYTTYVMDREKK